jgi:flagella basal body P-ring formation protein FlgA
MKDVSVTFDSGVQPLAVEPDAGAKLRITKFNYDPNSRRFSAAVDIAGGSGIRHKPARISGYLYETAEIVTLAHPLARGEFVQQNDIMIERRPREEIAADAIRQSSAIVGLAARRNLRAGRPVRSAELMKPELVGRNDPVTLVFESPGVVVSVRAKAIESGAEGDVIQVLNQQSKRTVQGVVEGRGRVVVRRMQTARYAGPVTTGSLK